MAESLGARLRHERERRQIALKSIAEGTKISIGLLEGLERDDVSRWPSGIFRKSFVRAYAEAVGLNGDEVVRQFSERHPDPLENELALVETFGSRPEGADTRASKPAAALNPSPPPKPRPEPRPGVKTGEPLSVKVTISWSGSLSSSFGRLADWKIVRLLLDSRF